MSEAVTYEKNGGVVTLTLNRPNNRNSTSQEIVEALVDKCTQINQDLSVGCVIVTGAGKSFSSGGNVKEMYEREGIFAEKAAPAHRQDYLYGIQRMPAALYDLEVPTIAAVNGHAVGAGCDLALMCDMRIASEKAVFAESFMRVGLISGDGGAWFLPRIVGQARAYEMTFTGDFIDADTALSYGLVSRVVPERELMAVTKELADRIAAHPPHSLRLTKRLLRDSEHSSLDQSLNTAASFQALVMHTDDRDEAIDAFFEQRSPHFAGR